MTPAARLQAAIELIDAIAASAVPADRLVGNYFRSRRYAGSKDRRNVSEMVYEVVRRRGEYAWAAGGDDGRRLAMAHLMISGARDTDTVSGLFDGSQYGPMVLDEEETAALATMPSALPDHAPAWVRGNYPEWLQPSLERRFGVEIASELAAMQDRAPVDLRVNRLKADVAAVCDGLAADGIATEPGTFAPDALRLMDRRSLAAHALYRDGCIEIQDEGSQLAALLCDARPGMQVVDYCAGAGGKSLALAARMLNKGQIFAFDKNPRRLRPLRDRLQRAGARNIQVHALADPAAEGAIAALAGKADRVLLDVPCSGSGAWRRNPEAKWRLSPEMLRAHTEEQTLILDRAASLVAPGGRLIYVTCSILTEENEDRLEKFLGNDRGFQVLPIADVWREVLGSECPCGGPYLRLTPAQHGTDGFFVALLQRKET